MHVHRLDGPGRGGGRSRHSAGSVPELGKTTMNPLLLKDDEPVHRHAHAVQDGHQQLVIDSLQIGLCQNPNFQICCTDLEPLLTKSDLALHFHVAFRTLERWVKQHKLPPPIRISARHCLNGAPRWLPEDIALLCEIYADSFTGRLLLAESWQNRLSELSGSVIISPTARC